MKPRECEQEGAGLNLGGCALVGAAAGLGGLAGAAWGHFLPGTCLLDICRNIHVTPATTVVSGSMHVATFTLLDRLCVTYVSP